MQLDSSRFQACRGSLPDVPRWVETRWMLALSDVAVFSAAAADIENVVVRGEQGRLLSVIGRPATAILDEALADAAADASLLCDVPPPENLAERLFDWNGEEAILFTQPPHVESKIRAEVDDKKAGAVLAPFGLADKDCLAQFPAELSRELAEAMRRTTVMAAWVGQQPIAFCYASAETETWWDVSVDTLAEYRGRGFATAVAANMIERFGQQGIRATWGAVVSNTASRRVAEKLGFEPVDRLIVFERE